MWDDRYGWLWLSTWVYWRRNGGSMRAFSRPFIWPAVFALARLAARANGLP